MKSKKYLLIISLIILVISILCVAFFVDNKSGNNYQQQSPDIDSGQVTNENNQPNATPHTHTYGEWKIVKEATCTTKGRQECYCSCGEKKAQSIRATGHKEVTDRGIAATCTTDGISSGKHCSVCNEVTVEQRTIKAIGHKEVIDEAIAPTCTIDGKTEGKYCSTCNTVFITPTIIKASGHNEVVDKAIAATCTTDGKTEGKHCSVCGTTTKKQETIKKTNSHTYTALECSMCHIISPTFVKKNSTSRKTFTDGAGNKTTYYYCDGVLVLSGLGEMPNYSIYDSYGWAYYSLERVIIEDGITSVADWAFYNQKTLMEVELPKTLKNIGTSSFDGCQKISSITIPDSVTVISDSAFAGCHDLSEINYNGKLESLIYNVCIKLFRKEYLEIRRTHHVQKKRMYCNVARRRAG